MLKGSLAQIDLTEVIRLLASSQQTGLLHIMTLADSQNSGGCYFQLGRLVHATLGPYSGLDAVNAICRITEGTFAFEANASSPGQSLAQYPTPTLLEIIQEQLNEQRTLARFVPQPEEILRYVPGKQIDGLEASPDELALLLLCNGERNVREISLVAGMNAADLRQTLGRFCHLGLLERVTPAPIPAPTTPPTAAPAAPPPDASVEPETPASERRIVRYWRGKPIYE